MLNPGFPSRRTFLFSTGATLLASTLARRSAFAALADGPAPASRVDADQALQLLVAGNQRFVDGKITHPGRTPDDFKPLAAGQFPIAAIVSCADSRVAPEILFDQGIGDLFIIRVAGNYIDGAGASVKGSIEYAVAELNVPLIMVLGHSQCGAVKAAIKHIHDHDALPGAINVMVNSIKPAVIESQGKPGDPLQNAIEANVHRGVVKLNTLEPVVAPALKSGKLKVVGGTYDLATGKVMMLS
ncbi:Carbonic anhydrase [Acidisarcina polymorpha]|uniref:Carbonic anhydrase n=1 Tax=Acidisarcina polymorpha TaxID=2211140 RepID=A0A2Z5FRS7_9BACT|nr:carbonic anhydrase [Acidisarcina polymorpha]AXC09392.1 Carbonic anhydrase [Acidisarcina polymorpha]